MEEEESSTVNTVRTCCLREHLLLLLCLVPPVPLEGGSLSSVETCGADTAPFHFWARRHAWAGLLAQPHLSLASQGLGPSHAAPVGPGCPGSTTCLLL